MEDRADAGEDQYHTTADALASAMLQAASWTKFIVGENLEMTFGQKDIKKFGKKPAE